MPEYPLQPAQAARTPWWWLLSVTWAGQTFRWTSRPDGAEIVDANDDTFLHWSGLEVEYEARVGLFSDSVSEPSIEVGPLFLPEDVDVALLVERGHLPFALPAELSQWFEGDPWERRRRVVTGRVALSGYETPSETVSFRWDGLLSEDESLILRPSERLTIPNFPNRAQDDAGKFYPRVYGRPGQGVDPAVFSANSVSTGAYQLLRPDTTDPDLRILSGHRVEATVIVVFIDAGSVSAALTANVTTTVDGKGQPVTTVVAPFAQIEDKVWADWASADTNGGALLRSDGTGALDGAGEIIVDLLQLTNLPIDLNRWRAVADELNAYKLAFYIDDDASPLDWIRNEILPVLPLSIALGADGIYPIVWNPDRPALAALTAGAGIERVGGVEFEDEHVANEITLGYRATGEGGDPGARITLTGDPELAPTTDLGSNVYAAASWSTYGRRIVKTLNTLVVNDDATAERCVGWMSRAFAFPWRTVRYTAESEYAWLSLGDVVTLTDAELHWSAKRAIVAGILWSGHDLAIDFVIVADKLTDDRA